MAITAISQIPGIVVNLDARRNVWQESTKTTAARHRLPVGAWLSEVAGAGGDVRLFVQATAANQPFYCANGPGMNPGVHFVNQGLPDATIGAGPQSLKCTGTYVGASLNNQAITLLAVVSQMNSFEAASVGNFTTGQLIGYNGSNQLGLCVYKNKLYMQVAGGSTSGVETTPANYAASGLLVPHSPTVVAVRVVSSGGNTTLTFREGESDSAQVTISTPGSVGGSTTITVGGSSPVTGLPWIGKMHQAVIVPAALSDADLQDAIDFMMADWDIKRAKKLNVICAGDSNTSGKLTSAAPGYIDNTFTWPEMFSGMVDGARGHRMVNLGIAGKTAAQVADSSDFAAFVAPHVRADMRNIAIVKLGTNDLGLSGATTAATTAAAIGSVCTQLKAAGVQMVFLMNLEPLTTSACAYNDARIAALNALLLANYRTYGADEHIDINAEFVASKGYTTDPTLDFSDYIDETATRAHLTARAQRRIAAKAYKAVRPYLSSVNGVTRLGSYMPLRGR